MNRHAKYLFALFACVFAFAFSFALAVPAYAEGANGLDAPAAESSDDTLALYASSWWTSKMEEPNGDFIKVGDTYKAVFAFTNTSSYNFNAETTLLLDLNYNNANSDYASELELSSLDIKVSDSSIKFQKVEAGVKSQYAYATYGNFPSGTTITVTASFKVLKAGPISGLRLNAYGSRVSGGVGASNGYWWDFYLYGTNSPANKSDVTPMVRLYNPYSGEHLFTSDMTEKDTLVNLGWKNEGYAWISPKSGTTVYRLYNKYSGEHHYTTNKSEYDACVKQGWNGEGFGFYSDNAKGVTVYRLFNKYVTIGTHHYTTSKSEYDSLGKIGWNQENIGWYGLNI